MASFGKETFETTAMGCASGGAAFEKMTIPRRVPEENDVHIDVKFAGICHSDIHQAREEWGPAIFPMVPGHEIGGYVKAIGSGVTKYKVGDKVGIGCFVDSCRTCTSCKKDLQQYCKTGTCATYNSREKYPHCPGYNEDIDKAAPTYGGYSNDIVVNENYVCRIPDNLDLAAATPLLCAGITVFSPMKKYGLEKGQRLAVAGLGGLGHMAVKYGVAWGCDVTVLSRGNAKKDEALNMLGAHHYIDSKDADAMAAAKESFDMIIDTISAPHDVNSYLSTLDVDGTLVLVGASPEALNFSAFGIIARRKRIVGSLIGGIKETQDMLDFSGKHGIVCEIENINASQVNEAYNRTIAADVRYRFVIDTATI
jgi:alcohol dehydrogenase (NADP+)